MKRLRKISRLPVAGIDAILRRLQGVEEFTQAEKCILRIALTRSREKITLSDGTHIRRGDPLCELHLWNERVPQIGEEGAEMGWGLRTYRLARHSMRLLAAHVESTPRLAGVRAFRGESTFSLRQEHGPGIDLFERLGFDLQVLETKTVWERFARFWEGMYVWALIWAYNPGSLRGKQLFGMHRCRAWISRQEFLRRYLSAASQRSD